MRERATAIAAMVILLGLCPGAGAQDASTQVSWTFSGLVAEGGTWEMTVTASAREFQPGDGLTLAADFRINSPGLAYNIDRVSGIYTLVTGIRTFDADGMMIGGSHAMASNVLNSLDLPIEGETSGLPTDRFGETFHHPIDSFMITPPEDLRVETESGTIEGTVVHGILLDPEVPQGWYQLRIDLGLQIAEGDIVTLWGVDPTLSTTPDGEQTYAVTGPVAIGTTTQPRMLWTLFSSSLSSGGVIPVEDEGYTAISRHLGFSDRAILPMTDSHGGQIRYLIEPDFPLVWNPFMRSPGPTLELDYHSGWMEVRIENPDGTIVDLGGAEFSGRRGIGATTLEDRFAYSFSNYGRHRIEMTGWIKDSSNQTYMGGGVYEVYIARPLEIETNVLNGTPFHEDDFYDPGFQVFPPMPASVDITWELDVRSEGDLARESFTANANRWGYYSPPIITGRDRFARMTRIQLSEPGEYKVTYLASYREEDGTLWMGEEVINGLVVDDEAVDLASRPPASGSFSITSDARYVPVPADSGDTVILPVASSASLPTVYTFPIGFFPGGESGFRTDDSALMKMESGASGEFVTPRLSSSTGLFPQRYPEDIDRWAYLITCATRADRYGFMRVGEGSPKAHMPWSTFPWVPGELSPDAAGDIYHSWSGMIYRDMPNNSSRYGFYSSGIVVSDNVRTPSMQNEGDPLVSDGWGTHSLLLHNPAVRPGSIISEGEPFTPASYFLPLPSESEIEFVVTSPDGEQTTVNLTADESGYAYSNRDRIELDQQGVWQVMATLAQDDETGGILGINPGTPYNFYVISGGNDRSIDFHLPSFMDLNPEDPMVVLTGDLEETGIIEGTMHISTTFNGAVVEQTTRDVREGSFVYSIDLEQVSNSYANFDPFDARDRLVVSFFTVGLTSSGDRRLVATMIYIQDGVLYAGKKRYSPIEPTSREERLEEIAEEAESDLAHEIRGRVPPEGEGEESE